MAFTLQLNDPAPAFDLPGTDGKNHTLADYDADILVVGFTCNHCPYVIESEDRIKAFHTDYRDKGVQLVCINSNSTGTYAEDSFEHMVQRVKDKGFEFDYLRDESQEVAKAYGALRTPHFYVFGKDRTLKYTGRMDDSPRDPSKQTTHELRDAVDDLLAGREVAQPLTNPIGCNVKWDGQDAHWMPADACDLV
ncbi:MAG: thioredoxin family protein [Planctomycetota bacterium]